MEGVCDEPAEGIFDGGSFEGACVGVEEFGVFFHFCFFFFFFFFFLLLLIVCMNVFIYLLVVGRLVGQFGTKKSKKNKTKQTKQKKPGRRM